MSDALRNVSDYLQNIEEYVSTKARDILSELEDDLNELDTFRELFNDEYEARDAKDYYEEMSDIFDDVYDAQVAKDFIEAAGYAGLDDEDLEAIASELEEYRSLGDPAEVREIVASSDGGVRVADLERELERVKAENANLYEQTQAAIKLEDQRCAAIYALGGTTLEQAEIDQRAAEEQAYEMGLNDGLIVRKEMSLGESAESVWLTGGEQGIVDPDLLDE